jgi:glycosyltransferase involved in cell wall biosynthesis
VPSPELWRRRLIWRRRLPALCCDALIYNSRRVADAYHSTYGFPNGRARIVHNGEFPCDRRPAPPRALRIAGVGRVTIAKGADVLLDAFLILARRHPECSLTYYGDGDLIPTLRAKAQEHGLADRVRFPGHWADRDEMYAGTDILVQPSRRESMSNSVIEAMARGIPCVATDVGGTAEAIIDGQTGTVVRPNDPAACAEAICKLLDEPDRRERFADAAIARARSRFDIRSLMRKTVDTILGIDI